MKTNQVMIREFPLAEQIYNKSTVRQRTKDSYFNATDLLKTYNSLTGSKKQMNSFLRSRETKEFSKVIENNEIADLKRQMAHNRKAYVSNKKYGTWMHPYLFIDFAMWISPEFKYKTIKWVHDNLIKFRVDSGDNYNKLKSAIADRYFRLYEKKAPADIYIQVAKQIKQIVGIDKWNNASEKQLELRNRLEIAAITAMKNNYNSKKRGELLNTTKEMFLME